MVSLARASLAPVRSTGPLRTARAARILGAAGQRTLVAIRRAWPLVLFTLGLFPPLAAAEWGWPPLAGDVSGDLAFSVEPGAPKLHWQISARKEPAGASREFVLRLDGPGLKARAKIFPGAVSGDFDWRVETLELDLAVWHRSLSAKWPVLSVGMELAGTLRATGEGGWRGQKLVGRAELSWRDGSLANVGSKFSLTGVTLDLNLTDLATGSTAPGQALSWREGKFDVIPLGKGRIEFALAGSELRIETAALGLLGGELRTGGFAFEIGKPEFLVQAEILGVEIAELLPFLPPVAAEAKGRLDGHLTLRRREAGVEIGAGHLAIRVGQSAEVRLNRTPGLLSSSLPPNVKKLYPGLGDLEEGRIPIKAEVLEVVFSPEGDGEGRTATVRLAGGPSDPRLRAPVDLKLNVRGPLDWLLKLGSDSRVRFR